jgi:hypothetical protein
MAPEWLTTVAWLYLAICFCCVAGISYDITFNRRRQPMGVMNFVFPITALYFGPLALALYWRWGRAAAWTPTPAMAMSVAAASPLRGASADSGTQMPESTQHAMWAAAESDRSAPAELSVKPRWVTMAIEVSHCGAGCTLGDVVAEFAIFGLRLTIAGAALGAEYVGDYALALVLASSSSTSRSRRCAA